MLDEEAPKEPEPAVEETTPEPAAEEPPAEAPVKKAAAAKAPAKAAAKPKTTTRKAAPKTAAAKSSEPKPQRDSITFSPENIFFVGLCNLKHPLPVMPAVVAGIHVFLAKPQQGRRGWPGQARP